MGPQGLWEFKNMNPFSRLLRCAADVLERDGNANNCVFPLPASAVSELDSVKNETDAWHTVVRTL